MASLGSALFAPYNSSCPLWDGPWDVAAMAGQTVLEDEMFVTGRCETVAVRFGVLLFDMVLVAFAALVSLTLYVRALLGGAASKWNMRMTILTLAAVGPWLRFVLMFLAIFHKFNGAYHLLLALPLCCMFAAITGVVVQWLIVIAATNKLSHNAVLKKRLYYGWMFSNIVCTVVLAVLWGSASAFRYGDQQNVEVLNWLFAIGFLWLSAQGIGFGLFVYITGSRLSMQLRTTVAAAGDNGNGSGLSKAVLRVRTFTLMTTVIASGGGMTCLAVFIWFLATRNTPFGMAYYFFVMMLGFVPMEVACILLVFFVYRRDSRKAVTNSDSGSNNDPAAQKRQSSPSIASSAVPNDSTSESHNLGSITGDV